MKTWALIVTVGLAAVSSVNASEACSAACPKIYQPLCGSDGKTYGNQCLFDYEKCSTENDDLTVVAQGECPTSESSSDCEKGCPRIYKPVCGSDGNTYSNECVFNNAKCTDSSLTIVSEGPCDTPSLRRLSSLNCDDIFCTMEIFPMCGSDGKTYSNRCELDIAHCKNSTITLVHPGEC